MVFSNSFGRTIEARTLSMNETMLNSIFTVNVCACVCVLSTCVHGACSRVFFFETAAKLQQIEQSLPTTTPAALYV